VSKFSEGTKSASDHNSNTTFEFNAESCHPCIYRPSTTRSLRRLVLNLSLTSGFINSLNWLLFIIWPQLLDVFPGQPVIERSSLNSWDSVEFRKAIEANHVIRQFLSL